LDHAARVGAGLPEEPHGVARAAQRALGGRLVGRGLFEILLRHRPGLIKSLRRARLRLVSSSTPAAEIRVEAACTRSGLSMVKSTWPLATSSPSCADRFTIRPAYGANTWTVMSWLKSMLPTAVFSIGNSRSPTGSVLMSAVSLSESSTPSDACRSPGARLDALPVPVSVAAALAVTRAPLRKSPGGAAK